MKHKYDKTMLNQFDNEDNLVFLREYQLKDIGEISTLFYQTVHAINSRDYDQNQIDTWAPMQPELNWLQQSLSNSYCVVAMADNRILGFGNIKNNDYLDCLYVHKNYQRQGIATLICNALEQGVSSNSITVHASITAKPFFMQRGYQVIKQQQVNKNGVIFINYLMKKST